ncbi:unnamed protein product [Moneuplotes crassus]|uniref:Uncharacterized protein n=1 Tax=Euplotes crassus TaxID=5936 RepID=A0AAD1X4L0_EUPCR|nr:unnamed protein product [Moneuplotes crassus]
MGRTINLAKRERKPVPLFLKRQGPKGVCISISGITKLQIIIGMLQYFIKIDPSPSVNIEVYKDKTRRCLQKIKVAEFFRCRPSNPLLVKTEKLCLSYRNADFEIKFQDSFLSVDENLHKLGNTCRKCQDLEKANQSLSIENEILKSQVQQLKQDLRLLKAQNNHQKTKHTFKPKTAKKSKIYGSFVKDVERVTLTLSNGKDLPYKVQSTAGKRIKKNNTQSSYCGTNDTTPTHKRLSHNSSPIVKFRKKNLENSKTIVPDHEEDELKMFLEAERAVQETILDKPFKSCNLKDECPRKTNLLNVLNNEIINKQCKKDGEGEIKKLDNEPSLSLTTTIPEELGSRLIKPVSKTPYSTVFHRRNMSSFPGTTKIDLNDEASYKTESQISPHRVMIPSYLESTKFKFSDDKNNKLRFYKKMFGSKPSATKTCMLQKRSYLQCSSERRYKNPVKGIKEVSVQLNNTKYQTSTQQKKPKKCTLDLDHKYNATKIIPSGKGSSKNLSKPPSSKERRLNYSIFIKPKSPSLFTKSRLGVLGSHSSIKSPFGKRIMSKPYISKTNLLKG